MFELWVIILMMTASAAWFFFGKLPRRKLQTIMIYFWSIVLALGVAGIIIRWMID